MTILVFGHKGQLGVDLIRHAEGNGIDVVGADLPECDITQENSIDQAFGDCEDASLAINAAAYTAVDLAETNVETAYAVNREGAGLLADACQRRKIPLIHISTDYVFDGLQTQAYRPSDAVSPGGVYARSKAEGEQAVQQRLDQHLIVRVSLLFGLYGNNFVKTMLRLGREKASIRVVDDQIGSPTYAGDLAAALFKMAEKISGDFSVWGTYHYCNQGAVTWYAFARKIFALARPYEDLAVKEVVSILTTQYPTPAPRPFYSVLDCTTFDEIFDIPRRPWSAALKDMLAGLLTGSSKSN